MLSTAVRSPYVCLRCRSQLILQANRTIRPRTIPTLTRRLTTTPPTWLHRSNPLRELKTDVKTDAEIDRSIAALLFKSAENDAAATNQQKLKATSATDQRTRTWESAGLPPALSSTILRAFPATTKLSYIQREIVRYLQKGNSIIAHSKPGSGKSLAIIAWLLTLQRATRLDGLRIKGKKRTTTTALVLCPDTELVRQYESLVKTMLEATESENIKGNMGDFVQALYRGEGLEERVKVMKANPHPHILIATPTVLLDILSSKSAETRDLVDYNFLKAIVIEGVEDALADYEVHEVFTKESPEEDSKDNDDKNSDAKKAPLLLLLDYVSRARKVAQIKANTKLTQPQLIIPSSTMGQARIKRAIQQNHPVWLDGENRPNFTPYTGKGATSGASTFQLVHTEGAKMKHGINTFLPDTISHHIVAYDPTTGFLRNAPVPVYSSPTEIVQGLQEREDHEAALSENLKNALDNGASDEELAVLLKKYGNLAPESKRRGYPPEISAEVVESLLEHDNWPANSVVAVADGASISNLQKALEWRGIKTKSLSSATWNSEGRLQMGRTDEFVSAMDGTSKPAESGTGDREKATVFLAKYATLHGLDTPGLQHLYILHRLDSAREYLVYAGRVARWPYDEMDTVRDPRFMGKDVRPKGKVVSVVLEDHGAGEGDERSYAAVIADGSEDEQWIWRDEALRLAKIGLRVDQYFKDGEKMDALDRIPQRFRVMGRDEVEEEFDENWMSTQTFTPEEEAEREKAAEERRVKREEAAEKRRERRALEEQERREQEEKEVEKNIEEVDESQQRAAEELLESISSEVDDLSVTNPVPYVSPRGSSSAAETETDTDVTKLEENEDAGSLFPMETTEEEDTSELPMGVKKGRYRHLAKKVIDPELSVNTETPKPTLKSKDTPAMKNVSRIEVAEEGPIVLDTINIRPVKEKVIRKAAQDEFKERREKKKAENKEKDQVKKKRAPKKLSTKTVKDLSEEYEKALAALMSKKK
ncbi:hypothetical protein FPQ18DRAFT_320123 [Pyronema domesticum]|uniref:RNA helicase n=1 Tax=Pyronema omphalodes (strain CBS 100304) TaxID=1076935 RepID=U4LCV7_PYROM|nr:hypothetical protein FPQ18DRAFT_320123 [Pyronema domesticum]CCX08321.1 Similar to ATP-dependent RNA helicase ddx23; acc. no. Q54Y81 [Pyronema omphalodes CBS 100304]